MSKAIDSKVLDNGDTLLLMELSAEWSPWRYQVNRIVPDGKHYGRPGEPCRTSMSNFDTREKAERAFREWTAGKDAA